MPKLQSFQIYLGHALAGILANSDGSQFGGSKVATMATDIARKLVSEKENRIASGDSELFDIFAGRALEGILANPDGLDHGGSWVAAKVLSYCETMMAQPELADNSPRGHLLRHLAACALGGLLTQPEVLTFGASKAAALAMGQARTGIDKSGG